MPKKLKESVGNGCLQVVVKKKKKKNPDLLNVLAIYLSIYNLKTVSYIPGCPQTHCG